MSLSVVGAVAVVAVTTYRLNFHLFNAIKNGQVQFFFSVNVPPTSLASEFVCLKQAQTS